MPRLLRPLARLLEMREEQRFAWERILARQRALLLQAGARLAEAGLLTGEDEVWFLTWDELTAALLGGITPDGGKVSQRRHAHAVEQGIPTPAFIGPGAGAGAATGAGGSLRGVGASSGRARGRFLVLRSMESAGAHAEDAIVVMPSLDPGHTVLLASVRGVVLERGGLLSHGALLAREYGVPMVVGVEAATEHIQSGQHGVIDGDTGEVSAEEAPG